MSFTLAESAELSQNLMVKGIIEELLKTSPMIAKLPFIELVGNALAINREDEDNLGSVQFRSVGGTWTGSVAHFDQVTYALTVLGGDADVDNFIQKTRSNINDQMAAQVKVKAKLMAHAFEDKLVYGDDTSTNEFDGLHTLTSTTGPQVHCGSSATGGALTIAKLDEAIDLCMGGRPDAILLNKPVNRRLSQYLRTVGSYTTERDDWGNYFAVYNGIPIIPTDWITQTETISSSAYAAKTGGACSSAFVIHMGEMEGLVGLQNGGIQTEVWERLESKDASRTRIKWYVGLALYGTKSLVRIDGITNAAVTA